MDNAENACGCQACLNAVGISSSSRFIICSECGNKRCPHATDHRLVCTGSNEPGQEGSSYQFAGWKNPIESDNV